MSRNTIGIQEWIPDTLEKAIDHIRWLRQELQATRILYSRAIEESWNCPHCCERSAKLLEGIIEKDLEMNS